MILPVLAYGHSNLRKVSKDITPDHPDLHSFLANLWETMYFADGVGLAAPQVNHLIRVFVIDAAEFVQKYPEAAGFKSVFINARILEEKGDEWSFNEGCLSVPQIREDVLRKPEIHVTYYDENFIEHDEWLSGINARIFQHEYDHLEGVLFPDRISNLRRMLLRGKLNDISKGKVQTDYKMIFPMKKR